jgi:folate-binding protein YgfZ
MTAIMIEALDPASPDAGVAAHYGDPHREQRTLATAAGVVDRSHRDVLAIPGPDRLTWLHSLLTQHLTGLAAGTGTEALLLTPHGHVEAHAMVFDDGATSWLDTEPGVGASLLAFLQKMVFLMRVTPADVRADWALLTVMGPQAPQALARLGIGPLAEPAVAPVPGPKFAASAVAAQPTSVYPGAPIDGGGWVRRGRLGYDLLVPRTEVARVKGTLALPECGIWAYEALRVAAGIPRQGFETDHRTIPAECVVDQLSGNGWLAGAVHLAKGCYRGQETVARVHNLGRPPRHLALLHLDGVTTDELPAPHTEITQPDAPRPVGYVGTAVRHYELGMIALGMVKRGLGPGADLRIGRSVAAVDG